MSRIRYLKPGFFDDEDLADCSPWARLLFAGLWGIADKNGRLEDRPRRIAAQVFPYDRDVDVDACLNELSEHGPLIVRYEVEGCKYIAIPGWEKHQKVHWKEPEGVIPGPSMNGDCANDELSLDQVWTNDESITPRPDDWVTGNGERGTGTCAPAREGASDVNGKVQKQAEQLFDEQFWPDWPTGGAKKLAKERFLKASANERQRIMQAERNYMAAHAADALSFTVRAENFIGGQKSYYDEWADGPPPASSPWYKRGYAPPKPEMDPEVKQALQPWQKYCLAWFDEHTWRVGLCKNIPDAEEEKLRFAVEEGRLKRDDVLAGRHP